MAINLSKGSNIDLSKEAPSMTKAVIGLGWKPRATDGKDFDLDASLFMLGTDGKCTKDSDFIFYKNLKSSDGSVVHQGDELSGKNTGDAERIIVDLPNVPPQYDKLAIVVTIHDAVARGQSFGQVDKASIRVVDGGSNVEVTKYDLQEEAAGETAMVFGELYRHGQSWKFRAVGQGYKEGLAAMCARYGLSAG